MLIYAQNQKGKQQPPQPQPWHCSGKILYYSMEFWGKSTEDTPRNTWYEKLRGRYHVWT